jgi:hypothetical protein
MTQFTVHRATTLICAIALAVSVRAQVEIDNNFKYNSGQDVQPVFQGWSHAPNGFRMHFGYLNRNWVQELWVPVGPANNIEPGGPDRGQPTFFATRANRDIFTIVVPKDWGKKELVWTVTSNGKTNKAIAWLQPEWEIAAPGGGRGAAAGEAAKNTPPTISFAGAVQGTVGKAVTLTATVTDDGLPKPQPQRGRGRGVTIGQETPPILRGGVGQGDIPVNVPALAGGGGGGGGGAAAGAGGGGRGGGGRGGAAGAEPAGPTVSWLVWRGPANAVFTPRSTPSKNGQAQTNVTFTKPGEYLIRARANDRALTTDADVRVVVK